METTNFKIYSASAGSGKTYTLVKAYLTIILKASKKDRFKQILAITFTNKAVNEMKMRIIHGLEELSDETDLHKPGPLFTDLQNELKISSEKLREKAQKTLHYLLHNYTFFNVSTIDKFNHRLIRTFARDLLLPQNFEVILESELILKKAVDRVISKLGEDREITSLLLSFALQKLHEDKSWDIALDLYQMSRLLISENDRIYLNPLSEKTLKDFQALKEKTLKDIRHSRETLSALAAGFFEKIQHSGINESDFNRGYIPKFFRNIQKGTFPSNFDAGWQEEIASAPLYPKRVSRQIAQSIDTLQPEIARLFFASKAAILQLNLQTNLLGNIVPIAVLNAIQHELNLIKEEDGIILISEFNTLLSLSIKNESVPFIYERLGEKYKHYFIDEFQDTSEMQWENLIPLIGNALESEDLKGERGSLFLVGDAKQAIYRWRGGRVDQFINLFNKKNNPFHIDPTVKDLPVNYRSFDNIVEFNNDFFKITSSFLGNPFYKDLFENHSNQIPNKKKGGFVSLSFLSKDDPSSIDEKYLSETLSHIKQVLGKGCAYSDICILVRKKRHGILVSEFLSQNSIPVVSSETLLLKHDPAINFLCNMLHYSREPENQELWVNILSFIAEKECSETIHSFIEFYRKNPAEVLFSRYNFALTKFLELSLFDALMYLINSFNVYNTSHAALQYFMEEVHNFMMSGENEIYAFLEYWEEKKDFFSVKTPDGLNAVRIMTIHKAKGLEFPIVIFPYANSNIYEEVNPKIWLPLEQNGTGFNYFLFNKTKVLSHVDESINSLYIREKQLMELDGFNLLYVALTRAIEQLYIITENTDKSNYFSGLFIYFLKKKNLWNPNQSTYLFGEPESSLQSVTHTAQPFKTIPFPKRALNQQLQLIVTRSGTMWETAQQEAIERGNLMHQLMAKIKTKNDVSEVVREEVRLGFVSSEQARELQVVLNNVVHHPEITQYYSDRYTIKNESDIYTSDGQVVRPDRINIDNNNHVVLIDYKTGDFHESYLNQMNQYEQVLYQLGYPVLKKILVFINEDIRVKFI